MKKTKKTERIIDAQKAQYKQMIVSYLETSETVPWKTRLYNELVDICAFLKTTGVLDDLEDKTIIADAKLIVSNKNTQ